MFGTLIVPLVLPAVRLLGWNADTARKLLLTLAWVAGVWIVAAVIQAILRRAASSLGRERVRFLTRQLARILALVALIAGLISIWFGNPGRFATMAGIITAGVAVALQRVITSFAAYLIILRGRLFSVGDRVTMAGVRGDVVALGFMQTTVLEMGEPPSIQDAEPPTWVAARQFTGRIVRVTNDRIFDGPVYNYTREFPFLWEEMRVPIKYQGDRRRAEQILLDAARRHTQDIAQEAEPALRAFRNKYFLDEDPGLAARVYWRLTDNWLELTVRFVVRPHGVREVKDAMSRDILTAFEEAKLEVASGTYEIVGVPPLRVRTDDGRTPA